MYANLHNKLRHTFCLLVLMCDAIKFEIMSIQFYMMLQSKVTGAFKSRVLMKRNTVEDYVTCTKISEICFYSIRSEIIMHRANLYILNSYVVHFCWNIIPRKLEPKIKSNSKCRNSQSIQHDTPSQHSFYFFW